MQRTTVFAGLTLSAMFLAAASGQSFTPGNLVVLSVGDGVTPLTNAGGALVLNEFTTAGTLVQTVPLPTAASGANRQIVQSGSATSEGLMSLSADGRYLIVVGYDAAVGTAAVASTNPVAVNRVIARIAADKSIDTTTAVTDAFGTNNIRAGTSVDGTGFWFAGPGTSSNAGVRYVALGAPGGTSVGISANGAGVAVNCRVVNVFANQLYASGSTATGPLLGVGTVGTPPPPTSGPVPITELTGFPTVAGPSSYDFWFADANTLYVGDDRNPTTSSGGIQKWTFDAPSASWIQQYTLTGGLATSAGPRELTGVVNAGVATIYCTEGVGSGTNGNSVLTITDTGTSATFSAIAGGTANVWYRGIRFAPVGGTTQTCYPNCDQSTAAPILNVADFTCFLQKFAAADSYANCDQSTVAPILNVADFTCFLQKYAAGCQ